MPEDELEVCHFVDEHTLTVEEFKKSLDDFLQMPPHVIFQGFFDVNDNEQIDIEEFNRAYHEFREYN